MRGSPVIVGIDPGTTTGIAVLDLKGSLLLIRSGKHFSRADISKIVLDAGIPIIMSSDINPLPRAVERIAAGFSARLIEPGETFSRKEKHETAKEFMKLSGKAWQNRHERDALVSGIYAWKQVRQMVERMESRLGKARITDKATRDKVMAEVLLKKRSIDSVIKSYS
jgi:hypothetical protein